MFLKETEKELVRILQEKKMTVTTVESCTGGMIASRIVDVPGASDVFKEAFVTYCDEAKHDLVGVSWETLDTFTAVSSETASEMAQGGARSARADLALSATGLAGPDGGTEEKPVGLVYIGCAFHGKTDVRELHLTGNRSEIRSQAAEEALRFGLEMMHTYSQK